MDKVSGRLWLSTLQAPSKRLRSLRRRRPKSLASSKRCRDVRFGANEVHSYGLRVSTPMGPGFLYATELEEYLEDCSTKYVAS